MKEIAHRCEMATGPCSDLDHEIWDAVRGDDNDGAPPFTRSVDAAMSLIPEGWVYSGHKKLDGRHFWALHYRASARVESSDAATAPLAICAVAMRVGSV